MTFRPAPFPLAHGLPDPCPSHCQQRFYLVSARSFASTLRFIDLHLLGFLAIACPLRRPPRVPKVNCEFRDGDASPAPARRLAARIGSSLFDNALTATRSEAARRLGAMNAGGAPTCTRREPLPKSASGTRRAQALSFDHAYRRMLAECRFAHDRGRCSLDVVAARRQQRPIRVMLAKIPGAVGARHREAHHQVPAAPFVPWTTWNRHGRAPARSASTGRRGPIPDRDYERTV